MENEKQNTDSKMMIPAAIVVAGLIVGGAIVYTNSPGAPAPTGNGGDNGGTEVVAAGDVVKVRQGDYVLGSPSAKVVFVEYGDFQCPFCGKFANEVKPKIVDQYVKSGKVAFIWRDFAFLGEESFRSAEAAHCAGEQGKFWDFHDYLFTHQRGENQGAFSDANLTKIAGTIKLDQAKFDVCFASGKFRKTIEASTAEGRDIGVTGTPASFINGKLIGGAQPFAQFQAEIEAALKK